MGLLVAPNVAGFKLSVQPTGVSLDAMTENFALQRTKSLRRMVVPIPPKRLSISSPCTDIEQ